MQDSSPLCGHVQSIVSRLLPRVVSSVDVSSTYGCNSARQAMIDLHSREKAVEYTDNLMVWNSANSFSIAHIYVHVDVQFDSTCIRQNIVCKS